MFGISVFRIICASAKKKMVRTDTQPNVAMVKNAQAIGNLSVMQNPRSCMCSKPFGNLFRGVEFGLIKANFFSPCQFSWSNISHVSLVFAARVTGPAAIFIMNQHQKLTRKFYASLPA